MPKPILIVGGTGKLGAPVARALREAGHQVAILARDTKKAATLFPAGFEIREGNVLSPESLRRALADCSGVYINLSGPFEQIGVEQVVAAAQAGGTGWIGYISGLTVRSGNSWSKFVRRKLLAETAIRESGIPWNIFRPTWFMEALADFVRGGRAYLIGYHPQELRWIAAVEYAALVVQVYGREETHNRCFRVQGPEALTMAAALARYCEAIHPGISRIRRIPFWLAGMRGWLPGGGETAEGVRFLKDFARMGEPDFRQPQVDADDDSHDAATVFGPLKVTLGEWLEGEASTRRTSSV